MKPLYTIIWEERTKRKMSQMYLADLVGTSQQSIARIETSLSHTAGRDIRPFPSDIPPCLIQVSSSYFIFCLYTPALPPLSELMTGLPASSLQSKRRNCQK